MRYDTPIYFRRYTRGAYNPSTGNYATDEVEESKVYAAVTAVKNEALKMVYGTIKQGVVNIHIQNEYREIFDDIRIGNKIYKVDYHYRLRLKDAFLVSEIQ